MTALVAGSMVPDIPLFMGWDRGYEVTHSLIGVVTVDIVLTLGALLLWFTAVRDAVVDMAPEVVRLRLPERARLTGSEWLLAPLAAGVGVMTHVFWDAFTHSGRWGSHHVVWLNKEYAGLLGMRWLQYVSGVLGLAVVGWVAVRHLRSLPLAPDPRRPAVLPAFVLPGVVVLSGVAGLVSAALELPNGLHAMAFFGVVNSVIAVVALGLVACAAWQLVGRRRTRQPVNSMDRPAPIRQR